MLPLDRRTFLECCAAFAAAMGLPGSSTAVIAAALEKHPRPPVVWMHFQGCTGCTMSLLAGVDPTLEDFVLDLASLDYHETLGAAAGDQAEALRRAVLAGRDFVLVVEGAVPTGDGGIHCKTGGRTALDLLRETAAAAKEVIAIGSCAAWGGLPSRAPNPTGAVGIGEALGRRVVAIPGCPPNPVNFFSTLVHYFTYGRMPDVDAKGRPVIAFGRRIHDDCERLEHFRAKRFAQVFGDDGHRKGWCLAKLGCKGPDTVGNCPKVRFNGTNTWPVQTGHPCIGCTEERVAFQIPIHTPVRSGGGRRRP